MPAPAVTWKCFWKEHRVLGPVLLLTLAAGLVYLLIIPPWQHYDEPGHFEFAWLIANQQGMPEKGEYNQAMRRELAASMVEHNFYSGEASQPDMLSKQGPVSIGIPQISSFPVYHSLLSLPLQVFRASDITFQLYLARLVSLFLFLVTVTAAYGIACELTPPGHPLRWLLPVSIALIPSFADLMTALNDDVGATAFFSLFLWAGIALIRRGFSWLRLAAVLLTAGLCFFTKITVNSAVFLAPIPILLALFRGKRRWIAWTAIAIVLMAVLALTIGWGDAALWYRYSDQETPTRLYADNAPFGKYALQLSVSPGSTSRVYQFLPSETIAQMRGKEVTLGAWMWASQEIKASSPMFSDGSQVTSQEFSIGKVPKFIAIRVKIPETINHGQVVLSHKNAASNDPVSIYYDGLVLSTGSRPLTEAPHFTSARLSSGEWGGRGFNNLLRNASGESSWPWVRQSAEQVIRRYIFTSPSLVLETLLDRTAGDWYYRSTINNLFHTFWAVFGWGHVRIEPFWFYYLLAATTITGVAGALIALVRRRFHVSWDIIIFLALATILMWSAALVRGLGSLIGSMFIPGARYAYPAVIPTVLLLNVGWLEVFRLFQKREFSIKLRYLPFWLFFLVLNSISILTIYLYYYQP